MSVFGIESSSADFTFRTSTLDICQGRSVKIHESAWESVRPFVAELNVSISDARGECRILRASATVWSLIIHLDHVTTRNIASREVQKIQKDHEIHYQDHSYAEDGENSDTENEDFLEDQDEVERLTALSSLQESAANSDDQHEYNDSEQNFSNKSVASENDPIDEDEEDAPHTETEPTCSESKCGASWIST